MARTPRGYARIAGLLYLLTHVTSVLAVLAYSAGAVPAGVTLELGLALGCVGTGVILAELLRVHGPVRATTFALLRTLEAAIILAGTLPVLAAVDIAPDSALTSAAAATHQASFLVGQGLVIGANTLVLGWLLLDSRAVPCSLAVLGLAGGALVLTSDLAQLWAVIPSHGVVAAVAAVPIFAFEIWLAVRLLVRGLGPSVTTSDAAPTSHVAAPRPGPDPAGPPRAAAP